MIILYVIFTDLDNTLLDSRYSYEDAKDVLEILKEKEIPIVFCSAKTKYEQEVIRKKIGIKDPFIVEDGSAIYIPKNYFGSRKGKVIDDYEVIVLGTKINKIREEIEKLQRKYHIIGYQDMSIKEISEVTGLNFKDSKLAKNREFSETIVEAENKAIEELKKKFNVVIGGRFIHVFGKNADKGKAVKLLTKFYKEKYGEVKTIGIGDSYTDEPMLRVVDIPAIVKGQDGKWVNLKIKNLYRANGVGPKGWSKVIKKFILSDKDV